MDMESLGRVGIIGGGGWLGSAIAKSLIASGRLDPAHLVCSYRSGVPAELSSWQWTKDNSELVAASDVVIIAVRPGDWESLNIDGSNKLVISVMAGVKSKEIQNRTGSPRIARALPNAAAEVGSSFTPIFMVSDEPGDAAMVRAIFESCGTVDVVPEEDHLDYFTGLSGSGPAFPALLAEVMMNDAEARGIPADIAMRAALQTIVGAGKTLQAHWQSPAETVRVFIDYKGTTAAAILEMRAKGFDQAVRAGLNAAYQKAKAL
jgi:pyrroline-5-carboxylate reductase